MFSKWSALFLVITFAVFVNSEVVNNGTEVDTKDGTDVVGRMIEHGRTMVHHALKRFQFLLPAIFFKLGVAFTMLILVALASVSNGAIGFMLLVVGLSAVLARFQVANAPAPAPGAALSYHAPLVAYHRSVHDWDRSDKSHIDVATKPTVQDYSAYINQKYYTPVSPYAGTYYGQKL